MIKWEITGKEISTAKPPCVRKWIFYSSRSFPGWRIISVKHAEMHATGTGEWTWTDYIVELPSGDKHRFHRMIDAKTYVQNQYGEEK